MNKLIVLEEVFLQVNTYALTSPSKKPEFKLHSCFFDIHSTNQGSDKKGMQFVQDAK